MFSAKLNFCFHSWTWAQQQHCFFHPCRLPSRCILCDRTLSKTNLVRLLYLFCCHEKRHETKTQRVWSEDSSVVPNEAEEWWHTATTRWQNWPTLQLQRWTGTLTDVFNPPAFQNEPLCSATCCGAFHLLHFFTVRKSQHSCLLELAAILGTGGAILTGLNLPKRTKLGKGDNSPSFFWSVSWPAFKLCILPSSRLSHESVSKAPLCSSASNVVPFPAGSWNINNRGTLFPHQYTSILIFAVSFHTGNQILM